ncbi:hypothetical protein P154DRAFT_526963 [Amniculicola lignicola CBS 123094]|uniref:DNA replication regulator Sld3 C-terminal domain-containing protein n=1 Tax=Amniculicola lignicola CBS 123094 TaxID=1392246 RepID=A0A6A5W141_9PLEO|nr:hypothetical protein P154DRAFT_526963 [Amniculicola lignicola CBS 123094]
MPCAASEVPPAKRDIENRQQLPTKRKRESICGLGTSNKPFTIKPCPESPYDKPETFKPVRVIGRAQLPLTFLDTADARFPTNRLFSAHIDVLESSIEPQETRSAQPKVLIARYEMNKSLYAVERVQFGVYSLCKLSSGLKEKEVAELWDPNSLMLYPKYPKSDSTKGEQWWLHAVVKVHAEDAEQPPAKRVRMSMMRTKPVVVAAAMETTSESETARQTETAEAPVRDVSLESPKVPSTPQQLLETLVQQYLDAIYMSRTSLAYFAKGPITRIRGAFTSLEENAPFTYELVSFLRSMLLSHKAADKKYRERLPEIIKSIPPAVFSDDDLVDVALKPKKSRKKIKLSKEGVYPHEEEMIKKWWISGVLDFDVYGEETKDKRIARRVGELRVRETLAQMILMLEIVALEGLSTYKESAGEGEATHDQGDAMAKPKKRKRKLDDIQLLLDLLLDKLCIWQSVEQDAIFDFDAKAPVDPTGKGGSADRLQSFCLEVIVPFYMNRLPEQARMINKKLGGPVQPSPPKRKALKAPTTSHKPGESKEPEAKRSRRTLARVVTDTTGQANQRRPTPALNRSATDSGILTNIKREGSEVPLLAIPFLRSPSAAARQTMSQFKHLNRRQIDLSTPSAAATARLQQKKRVEDDLKDAISALKKPNRTLAAGSYVDENAKRGIGSANKSRKPINTVRKVMKDVQVAATPRAVRKTRDFDDQTPHHPNPFVRRNVTDTPPSSNFCIPPSGVRPKSPIVPGTVRRSVTARHPGGAGVTETPTKAPTNKTLLSTGPSRRTIFTTPVKTDKVFATPVKVKACSPPPFNLATTTPPAVFATPVKPTTSTAIAESPLPISYPPANDGVDDIYKDLGWDNDDDLL